MRIWPVSKRVNSSKADADDPASLDAMAKIVTISNAVISPDDSTVAFVAERSVLDRNAYDDENVAMDLGAYLLAHYSQLVSARFGALPADCDAHGLLAHVAKKRGLVMPGGGADFEKAAGIFRCPPWPARP